MKTSVDIYQGNQIGGCVTVITCQNGAHVSRIMIDYGTSLPGSPSAKKDFRYPWEEAPVDAVFFTHYHGDHVGRMLEIPETIPLYMGSVARKVMINIEAALCEAAVFREEFRDKDHEKLLRLLRDDTRIHEFEEEGENYQCVREIPGFRIEPYNVDHSAYDAYMFLIETLNPVNGSVDKVILHTGDFRGHGRQGEKMLPLIHEKIRRNGARQVDILVTEGTMMNRFCENIRTEEELKAEAVQILKAHKYAFLICSSTNLDSLASFYQAEQEAAREKPNQNCNFFTYSEYFRTQLKTFTDYAGKEDTQYQFKNVRRLLLNERLSDETWERTMTQKECMTKYGFLAVIKPERYCEKYIDAFLAADPEQKPVIIYSMWDGYLDREHKAQNPRWIKFLDRQREKQVEVIPLHTSGHASARMLTDVIIAVDPQEEIIPMHTENPKGFQELEIGEERKKRIRKTTTDEEELKFKELKLKDQVLPYSSKILCEPEVVEDHLTITIGSNQKGIPYAMYNMQMDYADFEALVFGVWSIFPECKIQLKFEKKEALLEQMKQWSAFDFAKADNTFSSLLQHYNRFLYRVWKMSTLYGDRFQVSEDNRHEVLEFGSQYEEALAAGRLRYAVPKNEAGIKGGGIVTENHLEKRFVLDSRNHALEEISPVFRGIQLHDQFPCGIFYSETYEKNRERTRIFNRGAFDLWGIDPEKNICLFELKEKNNLSMGIISELFFYSCVCLDIRKTGRGNARSAYRGFEEFWKGKESVKAYFLAPGYHKFMEENMDGILREMNRRTDGQVAYSSIKFDQDKLTNGNERQFIADLKREWEQA